MKRGMNDPGGQDSLKYRVAISNIPPNTSLEELDYLLTLMFKTTTLDIQSLRQDDRNKPKRATLFCNSQTEAVNLKAKLDKMPYNGYILSAFLIGYSAPSSDDTPNKSYINAEMNRNLHSRFNNDNQFNERSTFNNRGPSNEFGQSVSLNSGQSNIYTNSNVGNTPSREFRQSDYENRDRNEFSAPNFGNKLMTSAFQQAPFIDFYITAHANPAPVNEFHKPNFSKTHEDIHKLSDFTNQGSRDFNQSKSFSSGLVHDLRRSNKDSMNKSRDTDYSIESEIKKFRGSHNDNFESDINKFRKHDANIVAQINKIREANYMNQGSDGFSGADSVTRIALNKFPDKKYHEVTKRFSAPDFENTGNKYTSYQTLSENRDLNKEFHDSNLAGKVIKGSKFSFDRQSSKFQESYSSERGSKAFRVSDSGHCQTDFSNFPRAPEFQSQESKMSRPSNSDNQSASFEFCGSNNEKHASLKDNLQRKYSDPAESNRFRESNFGKKGSNTFYQYSSMNLDFQTQSCDSSHQKDTPFNKFSESNFGKQTSMIEPKFGYDRANAFRQADSKCQGLLDANNTEHQLYKRRDNMDNKKDSDAVRQRRPNQDISKDGRQSKFDNNQSYANDKEDVMSKDLNRSKDGNNKKSTQSREEMSFEEIMKQVEMRKVIMDLQNVSEKMKQAYKLTPVDKTSKKVTPPKKNAERIRDEEPKQISRKSLPLAFGKPEKKVKEKKKDREKKETKTKRPHEKEESNFSKSRGWSAMGPPKKLPSEELGQKILIEQAILVVLKQHEETLEKLHVYKGIWEGCLDIAKGEISDKMYELIGKRRMESVEDAIELYRMNVPRHCDMKIISEARRRLGTRVFDAEPFGRYMDSKEEAELRQAMQINELKDPYSVIANLADDNSWYVDYQLDKILTKVYKQNILKPDEEDPFKDITLKMLEQKVLSDKDMPAVERCIDQHLARLVPKIKEFIMESIFTGEYHNWLPNMIHNKVMQVGVALLPHKQSQRELHHLTMVSKAPSLEKFLKPYQILAEWQLHSSTHMGALLTLINGMQYEDLLCRNGCIVHGKKVLIYPTEEKVEEAAEVDQESDFREYSPNDSIGSFFSSSESSPYYPWDNYSSRESSPDIVIVDNVEVIEID